MSSAIWILLTFCLGALIFTGLVALVLVLLTVFGWLFGVWGLIPVVIVFYAVVYRLYHKSTL